MHTATHTATHTSRAAARRTARLAAALALTATLPAAARAQSRAPAPRVVAPAPAAPAVAPAPAPAPAAHAVVIPEGTEFYVVTTEDLSSKGATPGQRVGMKIDENVLVGSTLVIAKGTPVRAEVNEAKGAGMFGKGGKLTLRIMSTTAVDGQKVPLTGSPQTAGKGRGVTMAAVSLLVSPVGLFIKGKNATYPSGTRLTVYTDEAVTVVLPAAAAAGQ